MGWYGPSIKNEPIKSKTFNIKEIMEKTIFAYSWHQTDDDNRNWSNTRESLRIYGITDEGKTTCLVVNDFKPFVHVELPANINWRAKTEDGQPRVKRVMNSLNEILGNMKPVEKMAVFVDKYKLYGSHYKMESKGVFHKEKFPYIVLYFHSRKHIRNLEMKLKNPINVLGLGKFKLNVRETNVSPILQLCVERNLPSAGWIGFKVEGRGVTGISAGIGELVEEHKKFTDCEEEYVISKNCIYPVDKQKPAKAKIMAWDIEVFSEDGKFPDAIKPGNVVFQVSCVFFTVGTKQQKKYLLTLGDPLEYIEGKEDGCGKDTIVRRFKSEEELLLGLSALRKEEKPHATIGWNIHCFDDPFLLKRAKLHRCLTNFLLQGFPKEQLSKEKEIKWQSKAYGTTDLKFVESEGMISIDLMDVVQKDHKLDSYSLNAVSKYFLNSRKDDLDHEEIFYCYKQGMKKNMSGNFTKSARKFMAKVGKYCVQDSVLVADLFEHLQTWLSFSEMSRTCTTPISTIHVHGQQVKFFNQVYKYCHDHKIVTDKESYVVNECERYRGAEVFDPIPGLKRNVVPLDFSSLYPSLIIAKNMDYSTFVDNDDIPDDMCHVMEWDDHVACSHDPKVIRKHAITEIVDKIKIEFKDVMIKSRAYDLKVKRYETLYKKVEDMEDGDPKRVKLREKLKVSERDNMQQLKIIKHEALKIIKEYNIECNINNDEDVIDDIKKYISVLISERSNITKKLSKNVMCVSGRRYRFLKEPKGILPTIIQNLLDARKKTRSEIKTLKEKLKTLFEKTEKTQDDIRDISTIENLLPILDKRQNSYKVSANSMYGATGVRVGALPFMPIAMCTTYMGRKCIQEVKSYIEELGGRVVYGDTDSNYVTFDGVVDKNVKVGTEQFSIEMGKLWNHAIEIAKEISLKFPDPITLEFENAIYFKFLILTKKRYIYYSCGEDGTVSKDGKGKPKMGKRGVVLSRRDNCKFMKDVYSSVIDEIFDETESNEILYDVVQKTLDLYTRQIEYGGSTEKDDAVFLKDLVVTKSVGDYGGETCTLKPIMGKNDKGEDKWKIGNYVVPLITEDTIQSEGTNGMPMTEEEIKEWYLERLPGQVQLEIKVRRRGHAKEEGQRLSYVVTDIGYKGKQSEKIEAIDYFKAHSKVLKIDYGYYVERLVEPLDQVFQAVFYETENYRQSEGYSDGFKKTKLHSIFAKRGVSSPGNFTKDLHKLCSVTKPKMLNEIKAFSKPTLLFEEV